MTTIIYRADPPADDAALVAAQAAINAGITSVTSSVTSAAAYAAAAAASAAAALDGAFPAVGGVNLAISGDLASATVHTTGDMTATGNVGAATASTTGNATIGGALSASSVTATGALSGATLGTSGNATVGGAVTAASLSTTANAVVGGTLGVTGATTGTAGTFTTGFTVGSNTSSNPFISLNGAAGLTGGVRFFSNGNLRWKVLTGNPETGSSTGSDRIIQTVSDGGVTTTVQTITRATGFLAHSAQGRFLWTAADDSNGFGFQGSVTQTAGRGGKTGAKLSADNTSYVYTAVPAWATSTAYSIGDTVAVGFNLMSATSAGTSGSTTPTCSITVPTSSDGVVSWSFLGTKGGQTYNLIGAVIASNMVAGFGGTPTGRQGTVFGLNTQANIKAANGVGVIGYENDIGLTFPAYSRIGEQIIAGVAGTFQGSIDDVGWRIGRQNDGVGGGGAKFVHLMCWGGRPGGSYIDPNGYGLRCWSSGWNEPGGVVLTQGAGAIDLTEFNPSGSGYFGGGFILRGPGSKILGNGDIQTNSALIHGTSTGATLDANQYRVTGAAVHGGSSGTGWGATGGFAYCTDGSIVKITAVFGGAVTGVTVIYGAYSSSAPGTVTASSEHLFGPADDAGNATLPSTFQVDLTASLANSGSPVMTLGGTSTVSFANIVNLNAYTVATLPVAATAGPGALAYVSDATAPTYRGALVGGGTVKCLVFCDGTSWLSS